MLLTKNKKRLAKYGFVRDTRGRLLFLLKRERVEVEAEAEVVDEQAYLIKRANKMDSPSSQDPITPVVSAKSPEWAGRQLPPPSSAAGTPSSGNIVRVEPYDENLSPGAGSPEASPPTPRFSARLAGNKHGRRPPKGSPPSRASHRLHRLASQRASAASPAAASPAASPSAASPGSGRPPLLELTKHHGNQVGIWTLAITYTGTCTAKHV